MSVFPPSPGRVPIGDLDMDGAAGRECRDRLAAIVVGINDHVGAAADFGYLPRDHANHATARQYRGIADMPAPLASPDRVVPAGHDSDNGAMADYGAAVPAANRPGMAVIVGHRRIVLDIVCGKADIPRRGIPIAPGRDIHMIEHGIAGLRLGPDKIGKHW